MPPKVFHRSVQTKGFPWGVLAIWGIGAIALLAVGAFPLLAEPGTVTVRVDPATRAAPVNATFTVNIVADVGTEMNQNGLGAYEFDLVYDKNYLEVISVSDAGKLDDTGRTVNALGPNINNPVGRTAFGAYSYYADTPQIGGPKDTTVVLATVTLRAKRTGVTTLNLENALLTDTQANAWPDGAGRNLNVQGGTVTVLIIVCGDFDGDRKADIAVWRPGNGFWYIRNSGDGTITSQQWGMSTDILVPADYDGDRKTDIAVWRPSNGFWYIRNSGDGTITSQQWGMSTDILVPADYDGDRKT
ncbi:MAG: hypothetical protein FJZ88_07145, partial [Chloroflexi bacterium]|nr:hypothetical protein [Chloroflexota bacterium]